MNVAILGAGNIANAMADAINGLDDSVKAYGVASRSLEKSAEFARRHGFEKAYGSYEEMLNDPEVDLVYVATPHSHHYEHIKLCLAHGKAVLCEKAFTANSIQAAEVMAMAEEKGILLTEAMWTRYIPTRNELLHIIESGEIGEVISVEADFSIPLSHVERLQRPELAGGPLLDLGVYCLTFAAMFLGPDVIGMDSTCQKYETGVDATDMIVLRFPKGKAAYLRTSMVSGSRNEGRINGTKGYIQVYNLNDLSKYVVYDKAGNVVREVIPKYIANGYEYEVLSCKKALEEGKIECPEMPHAETMRIMNMMDDLRKSWGVIYPFEEEQMKAVWDRDNDQSILETYNCETGERKILAYFDHVIEAPNWSKDGKSLYYNSKGSIYRFDLEMLSSGKLDTGFCSRCNNDHVLSADGKYIAVSCDAEEDNKSRIYKIPIEGGKPELMTAMSPSYLHGWSPDCRTLSYCAERGGEFDIYTLSADGGAETRLTDAPGLNDGPEFDPTGEYIWFNSVRSGLMQVYRMKADGSEQTRMTFDDQANLWFPHVSPNGKKVVMLAYKKGDLRPGDHVPDKNVELRIMDADGSNMTTAVKLFGGQGTINVNSWSPDSREFAFVSYCKK
ncbi:MAG: Gfo/Idh/MocA family oxidoreductase [Acetatifactor sp.]|nr:Gfo/Idh/MocA family oxidoreductase [Acetatifactor sp.]